jgi:dTDP-4-amino-4,6-dideoxygalactose transaminase
MTDWILPWSGRSIAYNKYDVEAVVNAMRADPQTQGKHQTEFEEAFKVYHGARHSFSVSSCASALEIAATLSQLTLNDEVIIPAHTYCATAIPFARRNARIVWADIDPDYLVMTAPEMERCITKRTKAVVVVHLYGVNTPMRGIMELARKHNILVIEDCAQSLGATYEGRRSGWHGNMACYSFHGQKNITTLGEGGMITVKASENARKIPGLRHNGHRGYPTKKLVDFDIDGVYPYNFSIGEAQCALGTQLLKRLDDINTRRRENARHVIEACEGVEGLHFQKIPLGSSHTYHLLVSRHHKRDSLMQKMHDQKVETVIQYLPLYRQPLFRHYKTEGSRPHGCPNTESFYMQALSFPFYEWYTPSQLDYLVQAIKRGVKSL